jgi:hypothetical protein
MAAIDMTKHHIDPFRVAEALIAAGHFTEALAEIEDSIKQGDTRPTTLLTLALCLIETGAHYRAREALKIVEVHTELLPASVAGPLKQALDAVAGRLPALEWEPTVLERIPSDMNTLPMAR